MHLTFNQGVVGSSPSGGTKINKMGKLDKKKAKLEERIKTLEDEMKKNLIQKVSSTAEININEYLTKIADLKKQLANLK